MEMIQECAGNLLAELHDAQFEFEHGRMTQAAFLARIETLRSMARRVQARYCKPKKQPVLPGFENYGEAWRLLLQTATPEENHETSQAAYL